MGDWKTEIIKLSMNVQADIWEDDYDLGSRVSTRGRSASCGRDSRYGFVYMVGVIKVHTSNSTATNGLESEIKSVLSRERKSVTVRRRRIEERTVSNFWKRKMDSPHDGPKINDGQGDKSDLQDVGNFLEDDVELMLSLIHI